jgi:hypothetical protein
MIVNYCPPCAGRLHRTGRPMKKINDWSAYFEKIYPAQQAASKERFERFEALVRNIADGLEAAITAFNTEEQARGCPAATPDEISKALADVVAMVTIDPTDQVGLDEFIENLHLSRSPDRAETL